MPKHGGNPRSRRTRSLAPDKAERAEVIGRHATNVTDYVAADGRSNVAISADIHGVIQPIMAYVEK